MVVLLVLHRYAKHDPQLRDHLSQALHDWPATKQVLVKPKAQWTTTDVLVAAVGISHFLNALLHVYSVWKDMRVKELKNKPLQTLLRSNTIWKDTAVFVLSQLYVQRRL
jgi:hypothetical protein